MPANDHRTALNITRIDAWACRYPIERAVTTSFGTMRDRPAVFVRLQDSDGCFGWGEIFANWPAAGAEHRVNLLIQDIAELVAGTAIGEPSDLFYRLQDATAVRALQSGEWGPFRQVIAGLDIAIWDLYARRARKPLRKFINPSAPNLVPAYASGIHIGDAERLFGQARTNGFTTFKVKVGFDFDADVAMLARLVSELGAGESLCADANQAWDLETARKFLRRIQTFNLQWLEEPIRADAPPAHWRILADDATTPLAGGENIAGSEAFEREINEGSLSVLQPDVAKWGGVSGCLKVASAALRVGKRYCPHFLGGGIGLSASAHLLAAIGGDGMLEVDVNENPLRDAFQSTTNSLSRGCWQFSDCAGLGIERLPKAVEDSVTLHRSWAG